MLSDIHGASVVKDAARAVIDELRQNILALDDEAANAFDEAMMSIEAAVNATMEKLSNINAFSQRTTNGLLLKLRKTP